MAGITSAPGTVIAVGLGGAAAAAFAPKVEVPKQQAWAANAVRVPDLGLIAQLVVSGRITQTDGRNMANRLGFSNGTLDQMAYLAQEHPDFPTMLRLWRLTALSGLGNPPYNFGAEAGVSDLLNQSLAHAGLDWDYLQVLRDLRHGEIAGIGDIAYGVVRGILPAPSWVPVAPPTAGDFVPRFPQLEIDALSLANSIGYDENMLRLMVGRSGLSMAPIMAANASFRTAAWTQLDNLPAGDKLGHLGLTQTVGPNDYLLAIAEGDLRTEWATAVHETAREILTAGEYAELELRGFLTTAQRRAATSQHGMTAENSDLLYDVKGRAPSVHNITTGLARGATYPSDYSTIPESYKAAIQRSDIRPEFADIVYHDRYTYPSAFVLRTLAQAGDLGDQAAVEQVLLEIGWKPSFAQQVSTAWTTGTAGADKNVTSAQTHLKTATHKSYVAEEIDDPTATTALTAAGVAAAALTPILNLWKEERSLIRKQLTPAQIKKAWSEGAINPATGVAWTQQEAIAALLARGYDQADAEVLLEL